MNVQGNNGLLNTRMAAAVLGLSTQTLEKLRCFGGGPAYKKLGRSVRYSPGDLDSWINDRTKRSTTDYETRGGRSPKKQVPEGV